MAYKLVSEEQKLISPSNEESYDYVLVFLNPYDPSHNPNKSAKLSEASYAPEVARDYFSRIFKTNITEISLDRPWFPLLKQFHIQFEDFLREKTDVKFHDFAEFVLKCVVQVLQSELQLDIKMFFSRDKDEVFCKVKSTEHNLRIQADITDYRLQLRHLSSETAPHQAVPPYGSYEAKSKAKLLNVSIPESDGKQNFKHYDSLDREILEGNEGSLFQYKDRVRLILSMFDSKFERSVLSHLGILKAEYCLHNFTQLQELKRDWATLKYFWKGQDLWRLRNYFGEEVAMYFAWIEFYVFWLIIPGLFGLVAFLIVCGKNSNVYSQTGPNESNYALLAFALFLSIFSTLFDSLWTRKQSRLAWRWGTFELQANEMQRSEFIGPWEKDDVTGKMRKRREPGGWPRFRKVVSFGVVLLFVLLVLAAVIAIFLYRAILAKSSGNVQWTAFVNAIQIKVMGFIYSYYVARWLNDWENIESQTSYDDALSIKLFLFQFVNSYTSLFYIAFVKNRAEGCIHGNCMEELTTQLTIIFLTNLALNVVELGVPCLMQWLKNKQEVRKLKRLRLEHKEGLRTTDELSFTESQSKRSQYDTPLSDYMEIVIQYGYVVMFCASFPLAPLLAFFLSALEVRVDAWKLCHLEQRPFPDKVNNVGVWATIMQALSTLAAITNPAIIIFTAGTFDDYDTNTHWIIFLIFEHALLLFKVAASYLIGQTPTVVKLGLVWSERMMQERLMDRESDVDKEREKRDLKFRADPSRVMLEFNPALELDNY